MTDEPLYAKTPAGSCVIPDPLRSELQKLGRGEALLITDASGRMYIVMNWEDVREQLKATPHGRAN